MCSEAGILEVCDVFFNQRLFFFSSIYFDPYFIPIYAKYFNTQLGMNFSLSSASYRVNSSHSSSFSRCRHAAECWSRAEIVQRPRKLSSPARQAATASPCRSATVAPEGHRGGAELHGFNADTSATRGVHFVLRRFAAAIWEDQRHRWEALEAVSDVRHAKIELHPAAWGKREREKKSKTPKLLNIVTQAACRNGAWALSKASTWPCTRAEMCARVFCCVHACLLCNVCCGSSLTHNNTRIQIFASPSYARFVTSILPRASSLLPRINKFRSMLEFRSLTIRDDTRILLFYFIRQRVCCFEDSAHFFLAPSFPLNVKKLVSCNTNTYCSV